MIVEERNYAFAPADIERFLAIYESEGVVIATRVLGNLLGYFRIEVGHDLNDVVHWWGGRQERLSSTLRTRVRPGCLARPHRKPPVRSTFQEDGQS